MIVVVCHIVLCILRVVDVCSVCSDMRFIIGGLVFVLLFFFCCFVFFLMIRRPPRSTQSRSSAASDVYKRQASTIDTYQQKISNSFINN